MFVSNVLPWISMTRSRTDKSSSFDTGPCAAQYCDGITPCTVSGYKIHSGKKGTDYSTELFIFPLLTVADFKITLLPEETIRFPNNKNWACQIWLVSLIIRDAHVH